MPRERDTRILPVRIKKVLYAELDQAVKLSRQPNRNAWMIWAIEQAIRSHRTK